MHGPRRRCQKLLDKIKREQVEARAGRQFMTASCPICLEDFTPDTPAAHVKQPPAKGGDVSSSGTAHTHRRGARHGPLCYAADAVDSCSSSN